MADGVKKGYTSRKVTLDEQLRKVKTNQSPASYFCMALLKDQIFEIEVSGTQPGKKDTIRVTHRDETFEFNWGSQKVSILNTGDNVWDIVEGDLDQQTVNLVGDAIEKHYNSQDLSPK